MSNRFLPKGCIRNLFQPTGLCQDKAGSVLSKLENKMGRGETEPSNYPVYIATTIPFVV